MDRASAPHVARRVLLSEIEEHVMRTFGLFACTFLLGCAVNGSYAYAPHGARGWNDGYRSISLDVPRGGVELASFGLTEVSADEVGPVQTLHVRLVLTNRIDDSWCLDATATKVEIPGAGASGPVFVNAAARTLPLAFIDRGERGVFDLYFALPPNVTDEDDLPGFDVAWIVSTPNRPFGGRTHFDRQDDVAPANPAVVLAAGWGASWWSDPRYAWPIFRHESGVIATRTPAHVYISRPPRWQLRR